MIGGSVELATASAHAYFTLLVMGGCLKFVVEAEVAVE